ncbi:MAG: hypothetical protein H7066_21360, partial [Cytophagaceae bacterium]|nr:hypothetical protein [Gemmatimonadaceae bacterium]
MASRELWILDRAPLWAGALTIAVGLAVLGGWALGLPWLTRIMPQFASMKAITAACFILTGVALLGAGHPDRETWARWLTIVGAVVLAAVALLTLYAYASGSSLFLDDVMWRESSPSPRSPYPGRMSPNSAGAFLLLATSLLLRRRGTPRALRWSDAS